MVSVFYITLAVERQTGYMVDAKADALAQHDIVAAHLDAVLKTLIDAEGKTVREGAFHLQHINAHHSTLKSWV